METKNIPCTLTKTEEGEVYLTFICNEDADEASEMIEHYESVACFGGYYNALQLTAKKPKLRDGLIPPRTECPYKSRCSLLEHCTHTGIQHTRFFSCANARAFELVDDINKNKKGDTDENQI